MSQLFLQIWRSAPGTVFGYPRGSFPQAVRSHGKAV
jgi:hypothetical protein